MSTCITSNWISTSLIALGLALGLGGCAADPEDSSGENEASLGEVSAPLPLAAVSMTGATFGLLGAGVLQTGSTVGTGATIGTGTVGTSVQTGSSFGTGPTGFSSSFGTGPIGFSSSFGTGPIGFSTGGGTSVTRSTGGGMNIVSGTGTAPVITSCVGAGCL